MTATAAAASPASRTAEAEEVWEAVRDRLDLFHITRVADVTHLDSVGIPTFVAMRPDAQTLSVSQGKGSTRQVARASAVMEAVETWHCENSRECRPRVVGTAAQMKVGYPLSALPGRRDLVPESHPLPWVEAVGLLSGASTWVPADCLDLSLAARAHPLRAYTASTNGTAAGIDPERVVLHALQEVVERDAVALLSRLPHAERRHLDLSSLPHRLQPLHRRFSEAHCWVEVAVIPRRFGLVVAVCYLYSDDLPILVAGSCARPTLEDAAAGALMEAAQARVAVVTGTREDSPTVTEARRAAAWPATPPESLVAFSAAEPAPPAPAGTSTPTSAQTTDLARRVASVTGHEPLVVDLTHPDAGVTVRRVVAPGLQFDVHHHLPRTEHRQGAHR